MTFVIIYVPAIAAAAAVCLITSCSPLEVAAPPIAALTLPKSNNQQQLEAGREIYVTSCTKCHGPARIDRRSDEKWRQKVLPSMCKMAKLNPEQITALTNYVMTARKALAATPHAS